MHQNILVVDEIPADVSHIVELLNTAGYLTVEAADSTKALEKLTSERPWLFVVGEHLPDMTGYEFLTQALANTSLQPKILMTRRQGSPGDVLSPYFPIEIDIILNKPLVPQEFLYFVRLISQQKTEIARKHGPNHFGGGRTRNL